MPKPCRLYLDGYSSESAVLAITFYFIGNKQFFDAAMNRIIKPRPFMPRIPVEIILSWEQAFVYPKFINLSSGIVVKIPALKSTFIYNFGRRLFDEESDKPSVYLKTLICRCTS
jgi:hypothetical protein